MKKLLLLFMLLAQAAGAQTIADKLTAVNTAKINIRNAIASHGVDIENVAFTDYYLSIDEIETGECVASITGQIEVIATFGENISYGDPVALKHIKHFEYGDENLSYIETTGTTLDGGFGNTINFSSNMRIMTSSKLNHNKPSIYDIDGSDYTLLSNDFYHKTDQSDVTPYSTAISPSNDVICYGFYQSPYHSIWKVTYPDNVATLTKLSNFDVTPPDSVFFAKFHPTGNALYITNKTLPRLLVYARVDDTFIKLPNLTEDITTVTTTGNKIAFTPDGKFLFHADQGVSSPCFEIFKINEDHSLEKWPFHADVDSAVTSIHISPDGSTVVASSQLSSQYTKIFQISYDENDNITGASFTTNLHIKQCYYGYFFANGKYFENGIASNRDVYSVDYSTGVGVFTKVEDVYLDTSINHKFRNISTDNNYIAASDNDNIELHHVVFDTTATLADSDTAVFKTNGELSELYDTIWLGCAKESGFANEQKSVFKLFGGINAE